MLHECVTDADASPDSQLHLIRSGCHQLGGAVRSPRLRHPSGPKPGQAANLQNAYSYDNLGRMTRIEQAGVEEGNAVAEKRVDFGYNAAGQFTSIIRYKDTSGGGGNLSAETTFGYDGHRPAG